MKPSELIASVTTSIYDRRQRALGILASRGAMTQTALRAALGMAPRQIAEYRTLLDSLAEEGLIVVWYDLDHVGPGRRAVRVRLASQEPPAAS